MSDYTPELQHYQLLDLIGCGGMGYVYNGYEVKSQKPVAIKILSPECTHIEPILIRFKAEGHILRNLNHPNIVKFVEAGQEGQCHFLAMEYISGISLDSLPRSHTMTNIAMGKDLPTMEDYLSIFINCFSALDYIHKQQLVHRDIKPQNIILQGSNHFPRFIDFGIAKSLKNDKDFDEPGERLYTMVYASPEQLTSKPVDYKSDLFSFGVVMYEKLTGNLPFRGKSEIEIFIAQTKWNFPPPRQLQPEIPQKLEQIILKLLSKDPEQRYPTAAMVHGELEKLLDVIRQGQKGLAMSGIIGDIRGAVSTG
ncbi:serine/threonine protein kinase, partial [bacterium]|nr:serine/threonine protein kinase [bacterium]